MFFHCRAFRGTKELKKRKAGRIIVCATFGLFTGGLKKFDEAYEQGLIYKIISTNLTYQSADMLSRPYYVSVLRFIPSPVMTGFVNALGILIFKSQLSHFEGADISMYALAAAGMAIIYFFPKVNKKIPAPLVAIVVLTIITIAADTGLSRVADSTHKKIIIRPGDKVILSSTPIPGNEKAVAGIINDLSRKGADVIYQDTHVSGHACQEELKLIFALTKPQYVICWKYRY